MDSIATKCVWISGWFWYWSYQLFQLSQTTQWMCPQISLYWGFFITFLINDCVRTNYINMHCIPRNYLYILRLYFAIFLLCLLLLLLQPLKGWTLFHKLSSLIFHFHSIKGQYQCFMHPDFTWMIKIVVIPFHYPCLKILRDIDSVLVNDYLHLLYHSLLEVSWVWCINARFANIVKWLQYNRWKRFCSKPQDW